MTHRVPQVRLLEVEALNWRDVVDVAPRTDQEHFVAPVARYLCLAHYGGEWHPLAVQTDGSIVGHVMWAVDEADGSTWLGGLVIDSAAQGRGIGRAAVLAFLERFTENGRTNVALSYSPENVVARKLYADLGFVETGEMADDEIVARYQRN
jgi:diamine N-acetyltransferase